MTRTRLSIRRPVRLSPARRLAAVTLLAAATTTVAACNRPEPAPAPAPREVRTIPVRNVLVTYAGAQPPGTKPTERSRVGAEKRVREVLARLRAPGASFADVAREWSDDPVTAADGGFFGFISEWTNEAPDLVRAADALPEGGISDAIDTPMGFHVLQRLSREEGRRIEAEVSAVVEGVLVRTRPDPVGGGSGSDAAYADAASIAARLRRGETTVDEAALEGSAFRIHTAMRRQGAPGFEELSKAAVDAAIGEVIGPLATRDGWTVLRRLPYLRCYARHVLVTHEMSTIPSRPDRTIDQARARAEEALAILRAKPDAWSDVVRRFSDEPASVALDGYQGDVSNAGFSQRRLPPEFEEALLRLAPGERSGIVETKLGFHILWRID